MQVRFKILIIIALILDLVAFLVCIYYLDKWAKAVVQTLGTSVNQTEWYDWQLRRCLKEKVGIEDSLKEQRLLTGIVNIVGDTPYRNPGNNCYDSSKKIVNELDKLGVQSSILINKDRTHAWVALWIEATTGKLVKKDDIDRISYTPIVEIRDKNLNVLCSN